MCSSDLTKTGPGPEADNTSAPRSDLEQGLESFGRVIEGVAGRLLGPKAVGREELSSTPTLSKETDEALTAAGADLGRFFQAAGEAMKDHPLEPKAAAREAKARVDEPVVADPGWSPLSTGLRTFGEGLFKVAEGVLDQVAPRKSKTPPAGPTEDDPHEAG